MLGNGWYEAMCVNNTKHLCHIRGKMHKKVWIAAGDIILVGLRNNQLLYLPPSVLCGGNELLKPLTFVEINPKQTLDVQTNQVLAFGLPGNPVSCPVCFHLFVVLAIRRLSGWTNPHPLRVYAYLLNPMKADSVPLLSGKKMMDRAVQGNKDRKGC